MMSATMTDITCPNCGHTADDHKPGRGCFYIDKDTDCQCMYDPRQILLERIDQLAAELAQLNKRLEEAVRIKADDKVGFDWAVLDEITALRAAAEAALDELKTIDGAVTDAKAQGEELPETIYIEQSVINALAAVLGAVSGEG